MEELSQMSPDEFIKTLEKTISEKSKGDGDAIRHLEAEELADENQLSEEDTPNHPVDTRYIYYILQFSQLEEVIRFTKTVHYAVETSELYKMDGIYYLTVLIDLKGARKIIQVGSWQPCVNMRKIQILLELSSRNMVISCSFQMLFTNFKRLIWYDYFSITIYPGPDCNFFDQFDSNSLCEVIGL